MDFVIKQQAGSHGFNAGVKHVDIEQSKYDAIPRVGDTVTWPDFLPGMTVRHVEFNYSPANRNTKRVLLSSVTVWVS